MVVQVVQAASHQSPSADTCCCHLTAPSCPPRSNHEVPHGSDIMLTTPDWRLPACLLGVWGGGDGLSKGLSGFVFHRTREHPIASGGRPARRWHPEVRRWRSGLLICGQVRYVIPGLSFLRSIKRLSEAQLQPVRWVTWSLAKKFHLSLWSHVTVPTSATAIVLSAS